MELASRRWEQSARPVEAIAMTCPHVCPMRKQIQPAAWKRKGAWGKGKRKVSASDDSPASSGGAWDPWGQPPGLSPTELWMQAAARPPCPSAQAPPPWLGAVAPTRSLARGFASVALAQPRAEKLHSKPLPTATPQAPVKTENRFQALADSTPYQICC